MQHQHGVLANTRSPPICALKECSVYVDVPRSCMNSSSLRVAHSLTTSKSCRVYGVSMWSRRMLRPRSTVACSGGGSPSCARKAHLRAASLIADVNSSFSSVFRSGTWFWAFMASASAKALTVDATFSSSACAFCAYFTLVKTTGCGCMETYLEPHLVLPRLQLLHCGQTRCLVAHAPHRFRNANHAVCHHRLLST